MHLSALKTQRLNSCRTILQLAIVTALASTLGLGQANAANSCQDLLSRVPQRISQKASELEFLVDVAKRFAPLNEAPSGPNVKIMMGAIEIGKIPGLKTLDGKPLNQAVGGIGTVMNDTWSAKAPKLAERGIETIAVTPLMRNISKEGMTYIGPVEIQIEGRATLVYVHEYKMPTGGRILFLENDLITRRFDAIPEPGKNIYEMRDLPQGREGEFEKQRVWSVLNQATAKAYGLVKADAYIPQDGHLAPASYYIQREQVEGPKNSRGREPLTLAPVLHNERYLDVFYTEPHMRDQTANIWNVSQKVLHEDFMHGNHVVMPAPAIRIAERTGVFTAKSVANNTAKVLNTEGLPPEAFPQIELFARLAPEENFLAASNRPDVNAGLGHAKATELAADKITDPEVVQMFATERGYQFGGKYGTTSRKIVEGKTRAKRAVQKIFGMEVDPKKPLFVSFARLVEQKGLDFLVPNVMRILEGGGQIVVGGPVGDASGAATQAGFKALKEKLDRERPDLSRNFVVIEGPVMGRKKALLLAGHDFFPVPSRFEPCGLTDVEALFNGGQPIAPKIGGLVKGKNTIKYTTADANNQSGDLGWGIDQALKLYFNKPWSFLKRQVSASREDFSLERHLEQALLNQRIEIYYRALKNIDHQVETFQMTPDAAQAFIRQNILEKSQQDKEYLVETLQRIHPSRRSPLVNWVATH